MVQPSSVTGGKDPQFHILGKGEGEKEKRQEDEPRWGKKKKDITYDSTMRDNAI